MRHSISLVAPPLALLIATTLPSRSRADVTFYTITDLGTLGGATSFANDVNNLGQVTGNSQTAASNPSPRLNAFLTGPQGSAPTNLGVLPGSNNFSRGYAVNDSGVVVGESDNNRSQAFRYENGVMTNLGSLGGGSGVAHDINNAGRIVGTSSNGVSSRPFLYENGAMRDLGTLAGTNDTFGRSFGLSQSGLIAGTSARGGTLSSHATLWSGGVGGSITDLGSLIAPTNYSQAYAVNDAGQVVGSSVVGTVSPTSSTELYHAFRWRGGSMVDLGTLASQATYIHSEARDIDASGLAVGYVARIYNAATSGGAAVTWYADGSITDLNTRLLNASG